MTVPTVQAGPQAGGHKTGTSQGPGSWVYSRVCGGMYGVTGQLCVSAVPGSRTALAPGSPWQGLLQAITVHMS